MRTQSLTDDLPGRIAFDLDGGVVVDGDFDRLVEGIVGVTDGMGDRRVAPLELGVAGDPVAGFVVGVAEGERFALLFLDQAAVGIEPAFDADLRIGAADQVAIGIVGEAFDPGFIAAVRVRERLFDNAAERVGCRACWARSRSRG